MSDFLKRKLQRLIQVHLWGMEIHPTARIAASALIDRTWPKGVHIAEGCLIDEEAVLLTHDMTRGIYLDTHLGARSRMGARSILLPGVRVGEDCVIAPGAVVTKDMPNFSMAVGNPAEISPRSD